MFGVVTALFLVCIFQAIVLSSFAHFGTGEGLRRSFLDHLGLDEIPQFSKEEFENFQVPPHMKLKYDSLVRKQITEKKFLSRNRRSSAPSLSTLFNKVHSNPRKLSGFLLFCMAWQNII